MSATGSSPAIVVLGSVNMDLVARCATLPRPGETLTASSFTEFPGGKGANQAVAASRAGGRVSMIGRVGDDGLADRLLENLRRDDIDCIAVETTAETSSGIALITVADSGENQIVVVPGANGRVTPGDVDRCSALIERCDTLLLQLEVPLESVLRAIEIARTAGTRVILDPAPAPRKAPDALLDIDLICPNETEAALLSDEDVSTDAGLESAARRLRERGARAVAITLGGRGTLLLDGESLSRVDAYPVEAIDSTAAGDAFAGAVAVRWAETGSLVDAIPWGNAAGAIAASRHGAQPSLGTREEIARLAGGSLDQASLS